MAEKLTASGNLLNQTTGLCFQIEKVVIGICDFLTGIEDDCRNFIHEQLPIVITLLVEQYLDPTEICTMLTLCP